MKAMKPVFIYITLLFISLSILALFFVYENLPPLPLAVSVGLLAYVVLLLMIYLFIEGNIIKNSKEVEEFYTSLRQSLIASSIVSVFALNTGLGSALIPAIGGAIVEVVAGTSLFVYRQSLDQLNKYYEALHENERFLSVVNITDKISPEKKDEVYMEIIRSQLTRQQK